MPYATQRDRTPPILEMRASDWPASPLNVFLSSGFKPGVWNIQWENPSELAINSRFAIVGVNIYRSFDSEYGPYQRINGWPIGSTFWRDFTTNELVVDEDVSDRFIYEGAPSAGQQQIKYVFQTKSPIVKAQSQNIFESSPYEVWVYVDGVQASVSRVLGRTGEIELATGQFTEVGTQQALDPILPRPGSKVTCTYRRNSQFIRTDLAQRVFYRVTTVAVPIDVECPCKYGPIVETPLEYATGASSSELEKLDYIWREAIRRNRWILDQGGERVQVFLRKAVGPTCPCIPPTDHHKQPVSDCPICRGQGIVGGFEGPFAILVAPDDAEKRVSQKDMGRAVEHTYEVWTGPAPLLTMRDFLVKINGERFSIGAVRMPTNRGMVLQQHFNISRMDEKDIRVTVPMDDPYGRANMIRKVGPERPEPTIVTGKLGIPDERELRGRTVAWEDIMY